MTIEELAETIAPAVKQIRDSLKAQENPQVSVTITAEGAKVVDRIRIPDFLLK